MANRKHNKRRNFAHGMRVKINTLSPLYVAGITPTWYWINRNGKIIREL